MEILCKTLFDCSMTRVVGHYRPSQVPFVDGTGQTIQNLEDWNRARNQQRNWETLQQIISLRCQPEDIQPPQEQDGQWCFQFSVPVEGVYDDLDVLYRDCEGVPMIPNLDGESHPLSVLCTTGPDQNIWFESVNK